MDLQELDVMREIGSIGTSHAATALSKLLQKEVRISIPAVNILGYNDAINRIGNAEELVAAALVKMSGDIEGLMLFLFDLDFANENRGGIANGYTQATAESKHRNYAQHRLLRAAGANQAWRRASIAAMQSSMVRNVTAQSEPINQRSSPLQTILRISLPWYSVWM